ncbi:hypothetical protein M8J75_015382 [Diaphorina citri]|nr:hypothetical protein M8J75_015382 [Diaphorina citri]
MITADTAKKAVEAFFVEIRKIRESVDEMNLEETDDRPKRIKKDTFITRKLAAKEVCDIISSQVSDRFQFNGHLSIATLFAFEKFKTYIKEFPEEELDNVISNYPFINRQCLKTELTVIYGRDDFQTVTKTVDLLGFLLENNLVECFPELSKCLKIIITIPMTSSEAERSFSCLKRIKTFLRSTMCEERLTALAMLSMEKSLIHDMADFNDKVIDKFSTRKHRRMEFQFKGTTSQ